MPKKSSIPAYRHHKARNLAVVTINGHNHYLGPWKSKASYLEYDRIITEWMANGRTLKQDTRQQESLTVVELMAKYLAHAREYYQESGEVENIKTAIRYLKPYGKAMVDAFGPLALRAVREKMIQDELTRQGVNRRVHTIRRMFSWAASMELASSVTLDGLRTVTALKQGRTEAPETKPVTPVSDDEINAVKPYVRPQIWALIQLQRHSGMRPGEACRIRTCDIDQSGDVWIYRPAKHKSQWRGKPREIWLGPQCQLILRQWLKPDDTEAYLFEPRETVRQLRIERESNRRTPVSCGNRRGSHRKRNPQRIPGRMYKTSAYGNAIYRACGKAGIAPWFPNRIRHRSGTEIRQRFGLEAAQVSLGHSRADVTQIYAERDHALAARVAREVG